MFSTLDVDIRPGAGLGMFEIGASLWSVLDLLRRYQVAFPQVDVKYDPDVSSTTPIVVHVRPHLDLLFSGKHQRLHTICLRQLRYPNPPVTLRYKDTVLSSTEEVLTRGGVSRTFGPTYPGDDLKYPGVWFSFEDGISEHSKGSHPEDRNQEVKRVFISQKALDGEDRDALDEVGECPAMAGDVTRAVVKIHDGVTLHFHPPGVEPIHVSLGKTTAQDLVVDLGSPMRTHYKEDDRMTIHSTTLESENEPERGYFYNYFQYGLDFYISGRTHIVQKIVLHSNIPGSPQFQRYKRCNWEIEGKPEDDEDDSPPRKCLHDKFDTISHFLGPRAPPPSMLHFPAEDEDVLQRNVTQLYGYDGIILEVTESSQVVSVTLF
ncbi:hypothetical protein HGRIS_009505 [Hohenbuehelia grisea]|uniref:Uncharacterized protein n=1 Tax=Hohenbuehelia grisea TaxID=104357 RepID=A0ABR3J2S3_9AGAR